MILQPPAVLLAGPPGSGKTSALATQLLCGLEVFVIVTEPDGVESLLDAAERIKAPIDRLHWSYCPPASSGWMSLEDMFVKVSTMDQETLARQKDMGKRDFQAAGLKFLRAFRDFHCDRTDKDFGDFTSWDDTRSLSVDSLSGWSEIAFGMVVGYKPTASPGEWGIAQNVVFKHLLKVKSDRKCYFNVTAHVERETDEMTGGRKTMVSTIGAKLAPKIPYFFSEFVRCARLDDPKAPSGFRFTWSTIDHTMELKNRALPISSDLPPDFAQVVAAYERRKKLVSGATSPTSVSKL